MEFSPKVHNITPFMQLMASDLKLCYIRLSALKSQKLQIYYPQLKSVDYFIF